MAENNQPPVSPHLAFGLREVAGTDNNTVPGQSTFGVGRPDIPARAAQFPDCHCQYRRHDLRSEPRRRRRHDDDVLYSRPDGIVVDTDPRMISNLIADQTANNPAALEAQAAASLGSGYLNQIPNPAFDPGLPATRSPTRNSLSATAPRRLPSTPPATCSSTTSRRTPACRRRSTRWFTFFGQFFDHGLDLVTKGGSGTVFIPLQPDDPLITSARRHCRHRRRVTNPASSSWC